MNDNPRDLKILGSVTKARLVSRTEGVKRPDGNFRSQVVARPDDVQLADENLFMDVTSGIDIENTPEKKQSNAVRNGINGLFGGIAKVRELITIPLDVTGTGALSESFTIIPAMAGKKIKVYAVKMIVSAAFTVRFMSGDDNPLEGAQSLAAYGWYIESVTPPAYLFEVFADTDLKLNLQNSTGSCAGRISYFYDE